MKKQDNLYFTTGNTLLDLVVGGAPGIYGYPAGKFINIVGDKSSGKTFLASELIACAYNKFNKKQFRWVYDDCESGYSFNTKELYGFDIGSFQINSSTIENAFVHICNFTETLKDDQFGIYVLDSLDGLTSDEQDEQAAARVKAVNAGKNYDKGSYGMGKPKYLSKEFFPQLCRVIENKNVLVVIISQVRANINPFSFEKLVRSGGKAMDFYAHTVLWLATLKKIVKKGKPVGTVIKAKTTKSKTPRPFRDCQFSILFDYGVDNIGSNIDYLYELRTEKGELTTTKNIKWGSDIKKISVKEIKQWLLTMPCQKAMKKNKGTTALDHYNSENDKIKMDSLLEFINSYPVLNIAYEKEFGIQNESSYTRDNLIQHIESNNLETELSEKVIEKWEIMENSVISQRKKRYATQPKGETI